MLIIPAVLIFSALLAFNLPALYAGARRAAEASTAETQAYPEAAPIRPLLAGMLLCGGVLPAWILTHNPTFTLFVLLLGSAAYIDCVTQWVPDLLIFLLSWLALTTLLPGGPDAVPELTGAAVMLLPALLLNLITWLRSQPPALASGDLYMLPAIGVWLAPSWSGACLAMSLVLTAIAGRFVRGVPFITVLYPVFVAVSLCGAL
ncbi:Type IV leader peptidase family protein [Kosakonia radicincitans]|uniref:Type IV leader peptidase family protein n=1 Tax=Kosakonia radicincitans TaxID=283686 RepID=A0AAX2EZQ0_9ENTR|nr:prepilin peptidase [Kosakonia radicincitans]SFF37877.1 Type IV leader peptidase family protein [Kosakonia radicincitans]SFR26204.1 Type IV leader peptidase family protein [Kosakonia radicincitans]SFU16696.1 Type IV leader peptidase family protein [Kosakonia radicincitans]SFY31910.1 Type IV leader peptidase family protein [Kosakonia radicincitans]